MSKCICCGDEHVFVEKDSFALCETCIQTFYDLMEQQNLYLPKAKDHDFMKPMDIFHKLGESVIGQEDAKKALAVAAYNHYKRIHSNVNIKDNILLIGPTGCGKTYLIQHLAEMLDVPFVTVDATGLTQTGYEGGCADSAIQRLVMKAEGDIQRAERGIVYIDEIDKIAGGSDPKNIASSVGVQYELLKLMEGSEVEVKLGGYMNMQQSILINTKNILFICGGAFSRKKEIEKKVGFGAAPVIEKEETIDIIQYGLIPELAGRLSIRVELKELTKEELLRVLSEPKDSLVEQYKQLFKMDDVDLEFTQDSLDDIVDLSIKKNTGARGLKSIMEEVLRESMFTIPSTQTKKLVVTKEMVQTCKQ